MKKIHVFSFLCLIFFACDTEVNNSTSNNETDGLSSSLVPSLSSSSERIFSSSSEGSSSSSEIWDPPCKPYLSKFSEDPLYFNKQGGVDTVVIGWPRILFEGYFAADNKECEFFLIDHYTYGNIKVESEYCKNNYCSNDSTSSYSSSHIYVPIMKIECPWFNVTHISKDSVQVFVNKNETGKERKMYIPLYSGGCAIDVIDSLIIIQTSTP